MDTAGTKLGLGYCCSREQHLPREKIKSKTATGKATVTTEQDEQCYIHREAFLGTQPPPLRKGEKPSDSCSAKCCGHSQEFCTCPRNASLPTSTRTAPALHLSLQTKPGKRREGSSTGTLAHPLQRRPLNNTPEPKKKAFSLPPPFC